MRDQKKLSTYLCKTDINGNRRTILVNHDDKLYIRYGCHLGEFGEITKQLNRTQLNQIQKDYDALNYKSVDHAEFFKSIGLMK